MVSGCAARRSVSPGLVVRGGAAWWSALVRIDHGRRRDACRCPSRNTRGDVVTSVQVSRCRDMCQSEPISGAGRERMRGEVLGRGARAAKRPGEARGRRPRRGAWARGGAGHEGALGAWRGTSAWAREMRGPRRAERGYKTRGARRVGAGARRVGRDRWELVVAGSGANGEGDHSRTWQGAQRPVSGGSDGPGHDGPESSNQGRAEVRGMAAGSATDRGSHRAPGGDRQTPAVWVIQARL